MTLQQKENYSLEELNMETMVQFVHELRSPLHCVLSFSDLGRKRMGRLSQEKLESYLDEIHKSGQQCLELVEQMFEVRRNDFMAFEPVMERHDMQVLINDVLSQLQGLIENKGLSILQVHENRSFEGYFDQKLMSRVFMNLLSNAIKYSPLDTTISIQIEELPISPVDRAEERPHLLISISDEGSGVPELELAQIFERYSMGSNSDPSGLGLGLYISKAIIESHNGVIWAENRPENGACFKIAIPFVTVS